MPVDDNAFMTLEPTAGQTAFLHVSCTEWKNLFSLEIYGRDGKIAIDGLGGSYGVERADATTGCCRRWARPRRPCSEYPGGDRSWALEFAEFLDDIRLDARAVGRARGGARGARGRRADLRAVRL